MRYSPSNPQWINRDRLVLSNGHACALLYSMCHLTDYAISMTDLQQFRQLGSITPGHPENFLTPGVEVSTGPLGQGISNAVGMAMAEKHLAAHFNRGDLSIVDHFTYVICGDGCLQEGISSEACSLAGHLGLGKLIVCYDDNLITIDGDTALTFTEDVNMRYEAYNWHVQTVDDVNDLPQLQNALRNAQLETSRPSLIKIRTVIGFGSPNQGTEKVHGAPLGAADLAAVKTHYGFDPQQSFVVPEEVRKFYRKKKLEGDIWEGQWNNLFRKYQKEHPLLAEEFIRRQNRELPADWKSLLPQYPLTEAKAVATRNRSEEVLNSLAGPLTELMGGSADLTGSNLTSLKCSGDFQKDTPHGRYVRFGVREHAMSAICNGMFAHGLIRPFCATFLQFLGYAMGAVRVSALSRFGIIYIMTHDSIGLGEDGPTHQPVEMLESLRAIPNLVLLRPCDGREVSGAYQVALQRVTGPTVISLSRQATPSQAESGSSTEKVALGAYVLREFGLENSNQQGGSLSHPTIILLATGTEVQLAVGVAEQLYSRNSSVWVRVVSMPSCELFDSQPLDYQRSVLLNGSPIMSIEASGVTGWRKYAHAPFGLQSCFGVSAPSDVVYKHFGFSVPNLLERAGEVIAFYRPGGVETAHPVAPSLVDYPRFAAVNPLH